MPGNHPHIFTEILLHERRLKSYTNELSIEELAQAINKLTRVHEERVKESVELEEKEERKREKMREIDELMRQHDIAPEEFAQQMGYTSQGNKRRKAAKYQFKDENGLLQTWSGVGRRPKALQKKIDSGASLEDFLLKNLS